MWSLSVPKVSKAASISCSVGSITGMIPLTKALVMLEVRPVILTGVPETPFLTTIYISI